jgi:hypothetical protein
MNRKMPGSWYPTQALDTWELALESACDQAKWLDKVHIVKKVAQVDLPLWFRASHPVPAELYLWVVYRTQRSVRARQRDRIQGTARTERGLRPNHKVRPVVNVRPVRRVPGGPVSLEYTEVEDKYL